MCFEKDYKQESKDAIFEADIRNKSYLLFPRFLLEIVFDVPYKIQSLKTMKSRCPAFSTPLFPSDVLPLSVLSSLCILFYFFKHR